MTILNNQEISSKSTCDHDLDNAVRKGRATWFCPKCGEDISMRYLLYQMAIQHGGEI